MTLSASYINAPVGGDCLQFRNATIMFQSKKTNYSNYNYDFSNETGSMMSSADKNGPPEGIAFEIRHSV